MGTQKMIAVRAWDAPVRLFHWIVVVLLGFQIYSGKTGGNAMLWHLYGGYALLTLIFFRVLWGLAGGTHARFADFVARPSAAWQFAKTLISSRPSRYIGHNPLGGWMVLALLASIAVQAATGFFANDDVATEGPLAVLVSKELSDRLTSVHRWNLWILFALASMHIVAVLYHRYVKKENLIQAMFTGVKHLPEEVAAAREPLQQSSSWLALFFLLAAAALVFLIVKLPFLRS